MRRRRKPVLYIQPRAPEPTDDFEARELERSRRQHMGRFDDLAPEIRKALQDCPFDVHVGLKGNLNVETMVARIKAIRTMNDAVTFNQEFAARSFGRAW